MQARTRDFASDANKVLQNDAIHGFLIPANALDRHSLPEAGKLFIPRCCPMFAHGRQFQNPRMNAGTVKVKFYFWARSCLGVLSHKSSRCHEASRCSIAGLQNISPPVSRWMCLRAR